MIIPIFNQKKEEVGQVLLEDSLLKEAPNKALLYEAVKRYQAGKHHGTVDTKTRAEVHRTGKKIYRQKGTGGARHSSRKCAPYVGGGRVFGPHQRDYSLGMPKKARRAALREALRYVLMEGRVMVLQDLPLQEMKTKKAVDFFSKLNVEGGLVLIEKPSVPIERSIRNLVGFKTICLNEVNVFDLLKYQRLICTREAFQFLQERYLSGTAPSH